MPGRTNEEPASARGEHMGGTNGGEAGAYQELANRVADALCGYHEKLPAIEAEIDEAKSAALACLAGVNRATVAAGEAKDAAERAESAAKSCERAVKELVRNAKRVAEDVARETVEEVAADSSRHHGPLPDQSAPHQAITEVRDQLVEMRGEKKGSKEALTNLRTWVTFAVLVTGSIVALVTWALAHAK